MKILVIELPRDQVPFVGISDAQAREILMDGLGNAIAMNSVDDPERGAVEDRDFARIAQQYASGKHAVFIAIHTEPCLEVEMPDERGVRNLLKFGRRKGGKPR